MDNVEVNRTVGEVFDSVTILVDSSTDVLPGLLSKHLQDVLIIIIARITLPLTEIFGIITNTINLFVFWSMGLRDSVTSSFFVLSLADWCYLFASLIGWSCSLLEKFDLQRKINLGDLSYISVWYSLMFLAISVFLTTYIAIQKCCCVTLPFKFKGMFSTKRNAVVISLLCITGAALHIPILSKMGLKAYTDIQINASSIAIWFADDWKSVLTVKDFLVGLWIPISTQVINVICKFILISGLRKSSRFRQSMGITGSRNNSQTRKTKSSKKEIQLVKAVTIVTLMFIVANTAPICQALARRAESEFALFKRFDKIFFVVVLTKHALQHLNASLNLFVYLQFNATYRSTLRQIFNRTHKESRT